MNESLNQALEQISDKHLLEAAHSAGRRKIFWGLSAAVLALVIGGSVLWFGLQASPTADPVLNSLPVSTVPNETPIPPDDPVVQPPPDHSFPTSYYNFTSMEQIQQLFSALSLDDQAFEAQVYSLSVHPLSPVEDLRSNTRNFQALLTSVPLPCHKYGFSILNYYYDWDGVELFYDIDGIRYQILCNFDVAAYEGQPVHQVTLGSLPIDLYLQEGRLKGIVTLGSYQVHISCFTDDPGQVNLTDFTFGILLTKPDPGPVVVPLSGPVAEPVYPQRLRHPYLPGGAKWAEYNAQFNQPQGYAHSLSPFFKNSIRQFLTGGNSACSPVNVYMALAMLAECSEGHTRQQILDVLGLSSIESLRQQVGYVWNAHYQADGATNLTLANSLWLDNGYRFHQATIDTLAGRYYSSVYTGDLGSEEMNRLLRNWLDRQTGGLLTEQIQQIELHPDTVFALASTVYYQVQWHSKFDETRNTVDTFHAPSVDTDATYMHQTLDDSVYYYGQGYGAVALPLKDGGKMWVVLPEEGLTPGALLAQGDCLSMILEGQGKSAKAQILLSLPKFDITSDMDLAESLRAMGITDAFNAADADFSPLAENGQDLYVDRVTHGVRVAADEDGLTATAYTLISAPSTGMPEQLEQIEFNVNRPFLFVVTSRDGLPLFAGTVEHP